MESRFSEELGPPKPCTDVFLSECAVCDQEQAEWSTAGNRSVGTSSSWTSSWFSLPARTSLNGRASFVKPSQVAIARTPSPDYRSRKMYEIEVRKLSFKLPPCKRKGLSSCNKWFKQECCEITEKPPAKKYILKNISFEAKPGQLLAIAGPSGAGKSTLLEVLAGRLKPSSGPGSVLINGQIKDPSYFRRISGYVMQDDALFPTLTVEETLIFSARLRLPPVMPYAEKLSRVRSLIDELGLQDVANTRIGNEMYRGVSGGERRRVSIGVDVIHDPAVLFLDEPTSGLDSAAALNIVGMLRAMAELHGRTVILSIHQPSFRILQLIHNTLLLADGMVVHKGSLELLASRLVAAGHDIPDQVNVLEFAIDAINSWDLNTYSGMFATKDKGLSLQELFEIDQNYYVDNSSMDLEKCVEPKEVEVESASYANSCVQEVGVLSERFFKNISRTKELFAARSLQSMVCGVALGTIFLHTGFSGRGVQERLGFLAFTLTFFLSATTEALPIFLMERQILMRETSRGAYRISSYVVSNAIVFAPFLGIMGLLYCIPAYWLVGLNPSWSAFFFFVLVIWLVLLMANSFVAFFAAMVPNFIMGNSLIAAAMGAFFLFSGYFISKDNIPRYWLFMHYLSLFKYPFDALLINEYGDRLDRCFGVSSETIDCTLSGEDVLRQAGVGSHSRWVDVGLMVGFFIVYRVLCYIAVCYRLSRRRR